MKRKVLIVDFTGTSPVYTYRYAEAIENAGFSVTILGRKRSEELGEKIEIEYAGISSGILLFDYLINWLILLTISRKYRNIHIQWLPLLEWASLDIFFIRILKLLNSNIFYTVHNFLPHSKRKGSEERHKKLYSIIENLVVHNFETEEKLKSIGCRNIIKIDHGPLYSLKDFKRKPEKLLGMVGFIKKYKGIEDAVEAVALLKKKNIDMKLVIAGKGSQEYISELKELIGRLDVKERIEIIDRYITRAELLELYSKLSFSLFPYRNISQSGALLTSLGLGIPPIAYNTGGIGEIVVHGKNGLIAEKSTPPGLAGAVVSGMDSCEKLSVQAAESTAHLWVDTGKIMKRAYLKRKIIFFTESGNMGGAERMALNLHEIYSKRNCRITFIKGSLGESQFIFPGERVLSSKKAPGITGFFKILISLSLIKLKEKPDYIVTFNDWCTTLALSSLGSSKVIGTVHSIKSWEIPRQGFYGKITLWGMRNLYKNIFRLIPISENIEADLKKNFSWLDNRRMKVKRIPRDMENIRRLSLEKLSSEEEKLFTDKKILLYAGRLVKNKGVQHLIGFQKKLKEAGKDTILVIVGSGAYECSLKIMSEGISDIFFAGHQANPYKYMARSDLMLLYSEFEGMPNVVEEAEILGLNTLWALHEEKTPEEFYKELEKWI